VKNVYDDIDKAPFVLARNWLGGCGVLRGVVLHRRIGQFRAQHHRHGAGPTGAASDGLHRPRRPVIFGRRGAGGRGEDADLAWVLSSAQFGQCRFAPPEKKRGGLAAYVWMR